MASASSEGSEGHLLRFQDPGHGCGKTVIALRDCEQRVKDDEN